MNADQSSIVNRILATAKYAPVKRAVVERIAADSIRRYGPKRAADETKRLLHQIWGMYYSGVKLRPAAVSDLGAVLRLHQSTKERLPQLRAFYERIFAVTGEPQTIADFACGLNPLAFASLGFTFPRTYIASDIDSFTLETLRAWFDRMQVADRFRARFGDLLTDTPEPTDLTLLLKVLPVLEAQQKGSSRVVLQKQVARHIVVSYPIKSVSGREKGMAHFYREQFTELSSDLGYRISELAFPSELAFVLSRI